MGWSRLATIAVLLGGFGWSVQASEQRTPTLAERAARQAGQVYQVAPEGASDAEKPAQRAARQLAARPELASRRSAAPIFQDPIRVQVDGHRADMLNRAREEQVHIDQIIFEEAVRKRGGAEMDGAGLTAREVSLVRALADRDREVRIHEEAHYEAGRPYTNLPEYFTVTGPDGRSYAISGVTPMDTSLALRDKDEVLQKLQTLHRAALAPRQPSDHDLNLAKEIERALGETLGR